jgi:ABC-type antimicrobial peptide transport system permease subunit
MILQLLNDLRYGAKVLWKSKGVTIVAVVSLAIGIGANSAIFSLVNSMLLRPRPVSQPEQLVEVFVGEGENPYHATSYPSYLELRDRNEVFTGLAAYGVEQLKLGGDNVEQIWGEVVSGNYFDVLGVAAQKGRTFSAEEDLVPGRNPLPEGFRVAVDLRLDWRVVLYTITFSTITGILFGLAPALNSSKADVSTVRRRAVAGRLLQYFPLSVSNIGCGDGCVRFYGNAAGCSRDLRNCFLFGRAAHA